MESYNLMPDFSMFDGNNRAHRTTSSINRSDSPLKRRNGSPIPCSPSPKRSKSRSWRNNICAEYQLLVDFRVPGARQYTPRLSSFEFENKPIGSGSFSTVYRAKLLHDNVEYAIKKLKEPLIHATRKMNIARLQNLRTLVSI